MLRARYGFLLVVDEAHATLVTGQHGGGAAEAMGVEDSIDVHTGGCAIPSGWVAERVCTGWLHCSIFRASVSKQFGQSLLANGARGGWVLGSCSSYWSSSFCLVCLARPCPAKFTKTSICSTCACCVHTGTLSKAVGALGGFVACSLTSCPRRALLLNICSTGSEAHPLHVCLLCVRRYTEQGSWCTWWLCGLQLTPEGPPAEQGPQRGVQHSTACAIGGFSCSCIGSCCKVRAWEHVCAFSVHLV
jgi:hypothetical protein